ncbi:ATP-binding protein [Clostridium sp. D2Q-14]|uniref:nucleotide-binding protein n=1 Tax=Anaeromonas gelatinilytica TaxID=2683194 RepID=UPI00193BC1D9|nr:ATP-binding protein [Anaeromonas gelatinilytica]MBS4534125.1 ATP-binding protein [Anaeromonas gelatinilytica]
MLKDNRIRVITGHYGSGKTEFAVNYAVKLAGVNKKVAIVDLDVVNPYFRSREKEGFLSDLGIRVIGSSIKGASSDLPAISGEVLTPLQDETFEAVLDVGGDPIGARSLGRYHEYFQKGKYDMLFVINANRFETQTKEKTIAYLKNIEVQSRAKVTGLINNTHLLRSTTIEDVLRGQELCKEVSEELNVPIRYVSCIENVAKELPKDIEGEIFPIKMYMREDWMS